MKRPHFALSLLLGTMLAALHALGVANCRAGIVADSATDEVQSESLAAAPASPEEVHVATAPPAPAPTTEAAAESPTPSDGSVAVNESPVDPRECPDFYNPEAAAASASPVCPHAGIDAAPISAPEQAVTDAGYPMDTVVSDDANVASDVELSKAPQAAPQDDAVQDGLAQEAGQSPEEQAYKIAAQEAVAAQETAAAEAARAAAVQAEIAQSESTPKTDTPAESAEVAEASRVASPAENLEAGIQLGGAELQSEADPLRNEARPQEGVEVAEQMEQENGSIAADSTTPPAAEDSPNWDAEGIAAPRVTSNVEAPAEEPVAEPIRDLNDEAYPRCHGDDVCRPVAPELDPAAAQWMIRTLARCLHRVSDSLDQAAQSLDVLADRAITTEAQGAAENDAETTTQSDGAAPPAGEIDGTQQPLGEGIGSDDAALPAYPPVAL